MKKLENDPVFDHITTCTVLIGYWVIAAPIPRYFNKLYHNISVKVCSQCQLHIKINSLSTDKHIGSPLCWHLNGPEILRYIYIHIYSSLYFFFSKF
jgi:hypothetical protein